MGVALVLRPRRLHIVIPLLATTVLCVVATPAWAIDHANLEAGYPLPIEDTLLLEQGEQSFTVALRPTQRMDLGIEVTQGVSERWQVGYTGRLENVKGNSDGNVAVEAIWMIQRDTLGRPGEAIKMQVDMGQGNEEPTLNFTGILQGRYGEMGIYANGSLRYQRQADGFFHDTQWRGVAGGSLDLSSILGTPSTGAGTLSWERTSVPGTPHPIRLDLGIRVQPSKNWLVFASLGTDLSSDNFRHQRLRALAGITWDVTSR